MYSVKINLIGCDETIVPLAAREILQRWAVVDVEYPSVSAVHKSVLAKEGETRLFILHVRTVGDVADLKRLNSEYPRYPILAVGDTAGDPLLVMKCIRAGALQVVSEPVSAADLQEALDCIGVKHAGLSSLAKLVTVTGSVGGCGGTTVAINLAYELGRRAKARSILMELSLRKGMLANHLNVAPRYTTADLVADIHRLDSHLLEAALTEVSENFCVLAGPYAAIQTEEPDPGSTMRLVELTRHLAAWLVLDLPSTYDDLFFRSLMAADHIVLVADQTVAAIRSAQMLCDSLGLRQPIVVINRFNASSELSVNRVQQFLPKCEICTLPNDPAVLASLNNCQTLRAYSPRSPALAGIVALAEKIDPAAQPVRSDSLIRRLGRALSHA